MERLDELAVTGVIQNQVTSNNARSCSASSLGTRAAWRQKALLGGTNAKPAARQIAAVRRDARRRRQPRLGPIVSRFADEFRPRPDHRAGLGDRGYRLTFDTMGYIGNYPIEAATAPGGADAVVIMGYDYRNGSAGTAGSVAPIGGPVYDIADTLAAYSSRVPASQLILGIPYYGRAWSPQRPP
jgi:hypothetical protein